MEPLLPLDNASPENDVTFTWRDYLATNLATTAGHTDDTGVNSRIEARQYRIQIATDPVFQTIIETAVIDQTTFTSYINTYPEGTIYWRVQAIDGSQNPLAWSATRFLPESITETDPCGSPQPRERIRVSTLQVETRCTSRVATT